MDEEHGPDQKLQWMSDTDLTKNYNRWATWIQRKTTMDERLGPCCSSIVVFGWIHVTHLL
jgi:hypothetical protein